MIFEIRYWYYDDYEESIKDRHCDENVLVEANDEKEFMKIIGSGKNNCVATDIYICIINHFCSSWDAKDKKNKHSGYMDYINLMKEIKTELRKYIKRYEKGERTELMFKSKGMCKGIDILIREPLKLEK